MDNREKNNNLLELYLYSLETDRCSEHTIRSYKTGISQFFDYYGDRDFLDIDYPDADDYKNYLHKQGASPSTISLRISALRAFSKYVRRRVRRTNPYFENVFEDVSLPPKKTVREKVIWNEDELISLAEKLDSKGLYTEACLVALDVYSGRRRTELRSLRVEDFADTNLICDGKLYQTNELKTKGRYGGKYMKCYINSSAIKYVKKYMQITGIESGPLFPNVDDTEMGNFTKHINKYTDKHFHWHAGRHTFATSLYNNGVPKDIIVDLVGWSNEDMLKIYNDNTREQKIKKYFAS